MPTAGVHYPSSYADLLAWFPDDAACLDYLEWLRWSQGFVCPHCTSKECWVMGGGARRCVGCRRRISVTARTIFDKTRTPLTVWFAAGWFLTTQKNGVSALALKQMLGFGSYQTAWAMLHRYRSVMVRPGRERLHGYVEMDESFLGAPKPGKRGRGATGKVLIAIAIEHAGTTNLGRARVGVVENARAPELRRFLLENVEPGATLITDGLRSYPTAVGTTYTHEPINVKGSDQSAHETLPGVHRVASLIKRWQLGTHQTSIEADHITAYLNEFCFRFNRRHSRSRGMLFFRLMELAVDAPPVTYRSLVVSPTVKKRRPSPPGSRGKPQSLVRTPVRRPWRAAELG